MDWAELMLSIEANNVDCEGAKHLSWSVTSARFRSQAGGSMVKPRADDVEEKECPGVSLRTLSFKRERGRQVLQCARGVFRLCPFPYTYTSSSRPYLPHSLCERPHVLCLQASPRQQIRPASDPLPNAHKVTRAPAAPYIAIPLRTRRFYLFSLHLARFTSSKPKPVDVIIPSFSPSSLSPHRCSVEFFLPSGTQLVRTRPK